MRAYITVLSTNSYVRGVLALFESLKEVNSKYDLYVILSGEINKSNEKKLVNAGIRIIKNSNNIELPSHIIEKNKRGGFSQWNYTLEKLHIFDLDNFDKLVYLDSDMMITKNIDELFEHEHMSAVVAGKLMPGNENWKELNSGTMVIIPQKHLKEKILCKLEVVIQNKSYIGDQDLLQEYYYNWPNEKQLHLNQKYNIFFSTVEYYTSKLDYNCNFNKPNDKTLAIIHFEGKEKPWMQSKGKRFKKLCKLLIKGKINTFKVYKKYNDILNSIE